MRVNRWAARSVIIHGLVLMMMLVLLVPMAYAAPAADPSALFTTKTKDGVTLALKRYLPGSGATFRDGAQPVICMPGLSANFNYFDVRTLSGEICDIKLPAELAPWAKGDPYIARDPMKYYNMAHFLWLKGYDVWLANYRGEGRAPFRSGGQSGYAMDELGVYDLQAIICKVRDVTGKPPVWIGHSMGGTMAYIYLQGCRFGEGFNPHVVSDPALVAQRNGGNGREALKGFVDLDGPLIAVSNALPDLNILWAPLSIPLYVNVRPITETLGESLAPVVQQIENLVWWAWKALGLGDLGRLGFVNSLRFMNPMNMDSEVLRYAFEYCLDGISTRAMAQYGDGAAHGKFREDYKNGGLNSLVVRPPRPRAGDGYYYYSDNLAKISVPSLVIPDATEDITSPSDIKSFYDRKTRNALDEFWVAPNTAHLDIVMGLSAPTTMYPKIGDWLDRLCRN